jgi:hypothetical protein
MPFKETTSTTTTSSGRETIKGPIKGQSRTKVASISTTRRELTRGETAGGLLTTIGQFGMITITLITISISTALNKFDINDLETMTPNYNQINTYIPIENPLETINYQVYGEDVIDNILGWITPLSEFGTLALGWYDNLYRNITNPFGPPVYEGGFNDVFGDERWAQIIYMARIGKLPPDIYDYLTTTERDWVVDNADHFTTQETAFFDKSYFNLLYFDSYELFGGGFKWFFTIPSVLDIAIQEGYGT